MNGYGCFEIAVILLGCINVLGLFSFLSFFFFWYFIAVSHVNVIILLFKSYIIEIIICRHFTVLIVC